MATHSSVLAWRIPGTAELGGLPSVGSQSKCLQLIKAFCWRSLVGYSPWGREESDTTEQLHFHALEKEMATLSSVLAWRIPGTGELNGLPSMGSHRVGHD